MKKILVVFFAVLLMIAAFTVCDAAKKLKFVWVNPLQNYIGYVNQEKATIEAAKDYGIELVLLGVPSADGIIEKNAELLETAVTMRPDAILCVPFNPAMYPGLANAKAKGIPVIASGSDVQDKSLRTAYIGTDNKTMGIVAADAFNKAMGGKANVFIMMSQLDASNQVEAKLAFEGRIKQYPGIKLIAFDRDNADMALAMTKFDEVFRANKSIDSVWMLEGVGGPAAVKIAAEQKRTVKIIDVDDTKETVDNVRKGVVYATLAQNFYKMGYESVRLGYEICTGVKNVPLELDSGIIIVNKQNVDNYAADMSKAIKKKGSSWK